MVNIVRWIIERYRLEDKPKECESSSDFKNIIDELGQKEIPLSNGKFP